MSFDATLGLPPSAPRQRRAPERRPRRGWDVALTVVLLALLVGVVCLEMLFGTFLTMGQHPCAGFAHCSAGTIATGVFVAMGGPVVVFLVAGVTAVVRMSRRRIAFWVPIVGVAITLGVWAAGAGLVSLGAPH